MTWSLRLYFPSEGKCAADFYFPYESIASAGIEPTNLWSSGKHSNHYTTEATVTASADPSKKSHISPLNGVFGLTDEHDLPSMRSFIALGNNS
jgi:hypothetical protein